jgi:hypothetical protein
VTFKDLKLYGVVLLLIREVKFLEANELGNTYKIIEQPYRWLPFRITYKAIVSVDGNEIRYTVSGIPWTKVQIQYSFEINELERKTVVKFELQIEGKLLVFGQEVLQNKMMKAQDQLMDAIAKKRQ